MKQTSRNPITSCTIIRDDYGLRSAEEFRRVVTRVLQTEIQVRFYNGYGGLIGGRIWPISDQQRQELFDFLDLHRHEWDTGDFSDDVCEAPSWELKICTKGKCTKLIKGTVEPPPQGQVIRDMVARIVGDDYCYI